MKSKSLLPLVVCMSAFLASAGAFAEKVQIVGEPDAETSGVDVIVSLLAQDIEAGKEAVGYLQVKSGSSDGQLALLRLERLSCRPAGSVMLSDEVLCEGEDAGNASMRYSILVEKSAGTEMPVNGFQAWKVPAGYPEAARIVATYGKKSGWIPMNSVETDHYCYQAGYDREATPSFSRGDRGELAVSLGVSREVAHYCIRGRAYVPSFELGKRAAYADLEARKH